MHRLYAALLIVASLLIVGVVLLPVVPKVPMTVSAAEHGATIELTVDDTTVLTSADCGTAQWNVEGIRAVTLDRRAVTGEGTRATCAARVELDVTFQDGVTQSYTIDKQVRTSSMVVRALIVTAIFAFGLGLIVSGVPSALWTALRTSALGRAVVARLPTATERDDRTGSRLGLLLAVIAIVLIGAAVRTHFLSRSLRYDESWTYNEFASEPPQFIVMDYRAPNNHIFHTLLVAGSTSMWGVYPWTLRLPVYLAGVLIVAATFALGRRFYGVRVGLLAAALAAGSSWLIEYSANARGYNLITLAFLLQLRLAWSLRRQSSKAGWAAFALLGAFGLYTVPTMTYPLGIVCVWLGLSMVIENRAGRRWWLLRDMTVAVVLMLALTGLLYLPAYLYLHSGVERNFDFSNLGQVSWEDFIGSLRVELGNVWVAWHRDLAVWVAALLVIGAAASLVFHARSASFRLSLWAAVLLWLPTIVLLQMVITYARLWVFLLPLYLILASAGLVYLSRLIVPKRWSVSVSLFAAGAVVVAGVVAGGVVHSNSVELTSSERAQGVEAAIQALHARAASDAIILCAHNCPTAEFYGTMYGLSVSPHFNRKLQPNGPIYVIESILDARISAKNALREANVPFDRFKAPVIFMSEGDTQVFEVDPLETTDQQTTIAP